MGGIGGEVVTESEEAVWDELFGTSFRFIARELRAEFTKTALLSAF